MCGCGMNSNYKPPPWGLCDLEKLRAKAKRGYGLKSLALSQQGVTTKDVDLALWALLGRTTEEAFEALNGQ